MIEYELSLKPQHESSTEDASGAFNPRTSPLPCNPPPHLQRVNHTCNRSTKSFGREKGIQSQCTEPQAVGTGSGDGDGLGVIIYAGGNWAGQVPGLVDELTVWEGVDVVGMPVTPIPPIPPTQSVETDPCRSSEYSFAQALNPKPSPTALPCSRSPRDARDAACDASALHTCLRPVHISSRGRISKGRIWHWVEGGGLRAEESVSGPPWWFRGLGIGD